MDERETMNRMFLATIDEDLNTTLVGAFFSEGNFSVGDKEITADGKDIFYSTVSDNCGGSSDCNFEDKLKIIDGMTDINSIDDIINAGDLTDYKILIDHDSKTIYFTEGGIATENGKIIFTEDVKSMTGLEVNDLIETKKAEAETAAKEAEAAIQKAEEEAAEKERNEEAERAHKEAEDAAERQRIAEEDEARKQKLADETKAAEEKARLENEAAEARIAAEKARAEKEQAEAEEAAAREKERAEKKGRVNTNVLNNGKGLIPADENKGILSSVKIAPSLSTMNDADFENIINSIKNYKKIISNLEMPLTTPSLDVISSSSQQRQTRRTGGAKTKRGTQRIKQSPDDVVTRKTSSLPTATVIEDTELKTNPNKEKHRFYELCSRFNNLIGHILTTPVFFKINSLTPKNLEAILNDNTIIIKNKNTSKDNELNKDIVFSRLMNFIYIDCSDLIESKDDAKYNIYEEIQQTYGDFEDELLLKEKTNAILVANLLGIDDMPEEKYFIHIKKLTSIMMHYVNGFDTIREQQSSFGNIQSYFVNFIVQILDVLDPVINTILTIEKPINLNGFKQKIDDVINTENSSKIITFLKLTNRDLDANTYNKRFNILVNKHNVGEKNKIERTNMLLVKYNNDNFPYYNFEDVSKLNSALKGIASTKKDPNAKRFDITGENLKVLNYKATYLFGKFNKLFLPSLNNLDIAEEMEVVKSQAMSGKPVFLLGYGASGAGKTSSLIYFNKGKTDIERQGILIHLCNIFAQSGYVDLEVTSKEFFTAAEQLDNTVCKGDNTIKAPTNCITEVFKYTFTQGEFSLDENYNYTNKHAYRSERKTKDNPEGKNTNPFEKGASLGETMIYLIDTDRFVKATTNNPNSSRSHILVFVKLTKPGVEPVNLIVGDFAGVENKFQCEKPDVISKFLNIKRDDGSGKPYYSSEVENVDGPITDFNALDPIKGGGDFQCKPEYFTSKETIFDFANIVYRESIPKFGSFDDVLQLNLLKDMTKRLLTTNTGLADITKNAATYEFFEKDENVEKIKANLTIMNEDLTSMKEDLSSLLRRYLYKFLLGVEESEIDDYANQINDLTEKMETLNTKLKSGTSGKYNFKTSRGNYQAVTQKGDEMKEFKETPNDNVGSLKSQFDNEIVAFKIYKRQYENKINEILQFLINGEFKPDTTYPFYSKDPMHDTIPIKRKYRLQDIISSLIKGDAFFGKYIEMIKFAKITTDNNRKIFKEMSTSSVFNDLIDKSIEVYNKLYEIVEETKCRVSYGTQICENRVIEGNFINDSLNEIRNTIKEIMVEKNKDVLYNSPEYIDACLETYCPTHENCFELNKTKDDPKKIPSVIFQEIMNYLIENGKDYKRRNPKTNEREPDKYKFYKDIVVGVFCVFNISRQANNPPPTPYVDINRLKQLFYYENVNKAVKRKEFISYFNDLIKVIQKDFSDKVGNLLETQEYANATELINALSGKTDDYELSTEQKKDIQNFIDMVDKSNAVSAIGTLEFVDQMAKFNTVNTVCSTNSPYLKDVEKIITRYNLKDVVE